MTAPELNNLKHRLHGDNYVLSESSLKNLDSLFDTLDEIDVPEKDGDKYYQLWFQAPRGTLADFTNFDAEYDYNGTLEDFENQKKWFKEEYPDEIVWFKFSAQRNDEYGLKAVWIDDEPIAIVKENNDDSKGWPYDLSSEIDWMTSQAEHCVAMIRLGIYEKFINENLPYEYRKGTIPRKDFLRIYPDAKDSMRTSGISEKVSKDFQVYATEQKAIEAKYGNNWPEHFSYFDSMTLNKYMEICKIGYLSLSDEYTKEIINSLDNTDARTLCTRFSDDRNGNLFNIEPDNSEAFDEWFNRPKDSWSDDRYGNDSHCWEFIQGSSRTRSHLSVRKNEKGYYLTLSGCEFCTPRDTVEIYTALRKAGIPVYLYDAEAYNTMLTEKDKIGIVPSFDQPSDYLYGGFGPKEDVYDFFNLSEIEDENTRNEIIANTDWFPLNSYKLKEIFYEMDDRDEL